MTRFLVRILLCAILCGTHFTIALDTDSILSQELFMEDQDIIKLPHSEKYHSRIRSIRGGVGSRKDRLLQLSRTPGVYEKAVQEQKIPAEPLKPKHQNPDNILDVYYRSNLPKLLKSNVANVGYEERYRHEVIAENDESTNELTGPMDGQSDEIAGDESDNEKDDYEGDTDNNLTDPEAEFKEDQTSLDDNGSQGRTFGHEDAEILRASVDDFEYRKQRFKFTAPRLTQTGRPMKFSRNDFQKSGLRLMLSSKNDFVKSDLGLKHNIKLVFNALSLDVQDAVAERGIETFQDNSKGDQEFILPETLESLTETDLHSPVVHGLDNTAATLPFESEDMPSDDDYSDIEEWTDLFHSGDISDAEITTDEELDPAEYDDDVSDFDSDLEA